MQDNQQLTLPGFPQLQVQFPEHEQLRCPRCDSADTKFCYYNNYNLSQPRHLCKSCKRYWTKGGTLRNIPVGGGCRKNSKRPAAASNSSKQQRVSGSGSEMTLKNSQHPTPKPDPCPIVRDAGDGSGPGVPAESFTSLLGLASDGHLGNFINGSGQKSSSEILPGSVSSSEGFMISGVQSGSEGNYWVSDNNGWPNVGIKTTSPGSKLQ